MESRSVVASTGRDESEAIIKRVLRIKNWLFGEIF